ncbi:uncharacterized protein LOC124274010 [Haliotis rubra]|uniref:uncharacterized protein LOC124274010 n=1 Tax=Haliotis rubra TaxID=36100 RepID=UPI001EE61A1B|nr:uncharacterized protein LOC124274010 [Haliotis rubra]
MGHWRWCTWIGYIHLLILAGGTQDFQQPYIAAQDTAHVDRGVKLSCYSVSMVPPLQDASINWRRNGLPLDESSVYSIKQNLDWILWQKWHIVQIYESTITVSDVNTAKGDNFQCQLVIGPRTVSGWSEVYVLAKQSGSGEDYTVVREGHSAFITWKMPLVDEEFSVRTPKDTLLFNIKSPWFYIYNLYRTRANIMQITTSANSVILQFWLHNTTQEDAGKYLCSIPNCHHMLYIQGR